MAGESPTQGVLNPGAPGSTCTSSPLGSMVSNPAPASAGQGAEAITSAQHNPHPPGQLPQNMGLNVAGGMNQLNYQQGGQQAQIIGQGAQQKPGIRQQFSPANLQAQQNVGSAPIHSPTANNSSLHRSSSAPRLGQLQHFNSAPGRPALYGHSQQSLGMACNHNLQQQQQQQQQQQMCGVARSAVMGQGQSPGHISMFSAQPTHFNAQSQYFSPQVRQKQGPIQGSQFQQSVSSGQTLQGVQTIGIMGSLGTGSQMRTSGNLAYQQRVGQGPLRSQQPQQQSLTSPQKIQAQNLARVPSVGSMNHQISGLSQGGQSTIIPGSHLNQQQWLKTMQQSTLPSSTSPSYQLQQQQRQQQVQLQHQSLPSPSQQQQQPTTTQQQPTTAHQQPQPQQLQQSHQQPLQQPHQQQQIQQSLQQQHIPRMPVSTIQKPATPTGSRPGTPASGATTPAGSNSQGTEANSHILGKRSIHDLVSQVDFQEKLDPGVEDILLDIADDFIESRWLVYAHLLFSVEVHSYGKVTTFACCLAKHRKSSTLEAKDILLHLEKNWHLTIPGFTGEEFKTNKRPSGSESHIQRVAMIQKSMATSQMGMETGNGKSTTEHVIGSSSVGLHAAKTSQGSAPVTPSSIGSPSVQKVPRF